MFEGVALCQGDLMICSGMFEGVALCQGDLMV